MERPIENLENLRTPNASSIVVLDDISMSPGKISSGPTDLDFGGNH
jgi:hypothetical protein